MKAETENNRIMPIQFKFLQPQYANKQQHIELQAKNSQNENFHQANGASDFKSFFRQNNKQIAPIIRLHISQHIIDKLIDNYINKSPVRT